MTSGSVDVDHDRVVATIRLDRPDKRNAMTYAMWIALEDACTRLAEDRSTRVVVVRGSGGHFCAGADVRELIVGREATERSFQEVNVAAEAALAALPMPTVALIEGDCIGGGCAIAIDCDLRVAASTARFGITPAKLGVVYPAVSLQRVVGLLGPAATKRLLFTGDLIDAAEARRIGLVDEVHPPEALDAAVAELCAAMAQRSLLTQAATKAMIAATLSHGEVPAELGEHWARELAESGELIEGVAAFSARRAPRFTWTRPGAT